MRCGGGTAGSAPQPGEATSRLERAASQRALVARQLFRWRSLRCSGRRSRTRKRPATGRHRVKDEPRQVATTPLAVAAARLTCSRLVPLLGTTISSPLVMLPSTATSLTGSSGGASIRTMSVRPSSSRSTSSMPALPSSSLELGGRAPLGSTCRVPSRQGGSASSNGTRPKSTLVRPTAPSSPMYSATRGRRRSPSSSTVRTPAWVSLMARLQAVVDLPHQGRAGEGDATQLVLDVDELQVDAHLPKASLRELFGDVAPSCGTSLHPGRSR